VQARELKRVRSNAHAALKQQHAIIDNLFAPRAHNLQQARLHSRDAAQLQRALPSSGMARARRRLDT